MGSPSIVESVDASDARTHASGGAELNRSLPATTSTPDEGTAESGGSGGGGGLGEGGGGGG
eukprot:5460268-Pleurochrysis_carterae.AAC.1